MNGWAKVRIPNNFLQLHEQDEGIGMDHMHLLRNKYLLVHATQREPALVRRSHKFLMMQVVFQELRSFRPSPPSLFKAHTSDHFTLASSLTCALLTFPEERRANPLNLLDDPFREHEMLAPILSHAM